MSKSSGCPETELQDKFSLNTVMDSNKTKITFRTLLISIAFNLPGLLQAGTQYKGFEYVYSLSKNDFTVAHVNRKLEVSENKLTFTSHAYPVGFASLFTGDTITEQSIINITNDTFIPGSYSYVKQADKIKKQFHIRYNQANNTVTDSRVQTPFKLIPGTFDVLSFQLALAKTLTTSQPKLTFTLIDNKHSKTYKLEPQGEEQLEAGTSKFDTLKFFYFDEIKKRQVTIWCARELNYLPIQIKRLDNDGDYAVLKLISLKPVTSTEDVSDDNDF